MKRCPTCHADNDDRATRCWACGESLVSPQRGAVVVKDSVSSALPPKTSLRNRRYIIERQIGLSGFAITYKATDTLNRRDVAIKELFPDGCGRSGKTIQPIEISSSDFDRMKQEFLEEARLLTKFNHPHIVKVYDVFGENDTLYMVMEFVEGKTLRELLEERGGVMDEREAVGYILQVAEALREFHKAGYLHRNIKPDNIMVRRNGEAVLMDSGIASPSLGYAPLEQYADRAIFGPYTDIYALGATLYHLLTGQVPVPAPERIVGMIMKAPHELRRGVSKGVSDAVMKAMEIAVPKRPQTVDEFIALLKGSI